jgi:transglutaminase-like putative cysteine protease
LSTRAAAIPSGQAPEIMIRTAVRPTTADGVPRALDRTTTLKARVRRADGSPLTLPSIGAQRQGEDGIILIDVAAGSPEADEVDGDFLRSVPMADTHDEEIQAFARKSAGHKVGPAVRAEALRRAVNRHVNHKNLGTAFASASQTVRQRTGDCTEHAVLLAAALRCDGIPSRVVNGLIWTRRLNPGEPPAYVWHMWTQALLDGEWRDLDATLSATRPFHAAHLAVSANDLSRASINKAASEMLELMGDLSIEILEADTARR